MFNRLHQHWPCLLAVTLRVVCVAVFDCQLIESGDPAAFRDYLRRTKNTICGRHPIGVLMETVAASGLARVATRFVRYAQSNAVTSTDDSSVSYAAAVVTVA